MPSQRKKAVEMTGRGKRGKPKTVSPLFPPPLEIAARFPHSHRLDDEVPLARHEPRTPNYRKEPLLGLGHPGIAFRLIFQLEYAEFLNLPEGSSPATYGGQFAGRPVNLLPPDCVTSGRKE